MIPRTLDAVEIQSWKEILSNAISSPEALSKRLEIPVSSISGPASEQFKLLAPEPYLERINIGDPNDPLLKQILPLQSEMVSPASYSYDPLAEDQYNSVPGIIHKYRNRVLLVSGSTCAINCRYCFRRHFPYHENTLSKDQWLKSLDYIRQHTEINEVILSGGDPLVTNDNRLNWLSQQISDIPHIKRLRIHTRLPVVIPQRVDQALVEWLSNSRLKTIVVLHINHPNEIDASVEHAIQRIRQTGTLVLNQSVILSGINDCAQTLSELSEKLFDADVLPYYLHQLDKVSGAAHFDLPLDRVKEIYEELLASLPGYLVPKLVAEIPNRRSKTPIDLFLS